MILFLNSTHEAIQRPQIATDHSIQRDHVGGLEGGGHGAEVSVDEVDPAIMPDARGFLAGDIDEGLRAVDVCRARETPAEQLVMDDADSTADVQECCPCSRPDRGLSHRRKAEHPRLSLVRVRQRQDPRVIAWEAND